jgi:archaemetzincin
VALRYPPDRIRVVPLGSGLEPATREACQALRFCYQLSCDILASEPEPGFALIRPRDQYDALIILDWLEERFPRPEDWILAVTGVDLTIPVLTFVFGQARLKGRSGVISTSRLHEEFYARPKNDEVVLSRVSKEAAHEVGHMLGLTHCADRNCVMHASTSLADTDIKSARLCARCDSALPR